MSYRYLVLGAGMQGTAAAYDMAVHGEAERITLADADSAVAGASVERVNRLSGRDVARPATLDVRDHATLVAAMAGHDVALSAVPYGFNLDITRAAIKACVSLCDLGGNTDIVFQQLALHEDAAAAGVTILPDCGFMPGMGNVFIAHGISLLDRCDSVESWDGGLPQTPRGPLKYKLVFSLEGLINEYAGDCVVLREGRRAILPCLTEVEEIDFPAPVGRAEAFITGGGISTLPWTFEGQVQEMQNKTVRFPGHCAAFAAYRDLGLFSEEPITFEGQQISPRRLLFDLLRPLIDFPDDPRDLCVMRTRCRGAKDGRPATLTFDLIDHYDPQTGFTSMERMTGFPASLGAIMIAGGRLAAGARPMEVVMPTGEFIDGLKARGFQIEQRLTM